MKIYKILPDKSIRYGLIEVLSQFPEICAVEYGPEGTMHYLSAAMADKSDNVFTSGIKEKDVIFGMTAMIEKAVMDIDKRKSPRYIVIMASCVTEIIGTDINASARILSSRVNAKQVIPMDNIPFDSDYSDGWRMFCKTAAEKIVPEIPQGETLKGHYNILGINQTDYHGKADRREIIRMLSDYMGLTCMNTENGGIMLDNLAKAEFNIVTRQEAIPLAEAVKIKFGVPYICSCPYGVIGTTKLLGKVKALCGIDFKTSRIYNEDLLMAKKASVFLKGHFRSMTDFSAVLYGDFDRISSIYNFLTEECLAKNVTAVCSHRFKGPMGKVGKKKTEKEFISMMNEKTPRLLIANEVYCDYFRDISKGFTMFTPVTHLTDMNEFSPYMGMRGTVNLVQDLVNRMEQL